LSLRSIALALGLAAALGFAAPAGAQRDRLSADVAASRGFWTWETANQAVRAANGLYCPRTMGRFDLGELSFRHEVADGGAYCHYTARGEADLFVLMAPPRWQPADEARARLRLGSEIGSLQWGETEDYDIGNCRGVRNSFRWESRMETTLLLAAGERILSITLFSSGQPGAEDVALLDAAALASGGC
jgi:hypothetical protein